MYIYVLLIVKKLVITMEKNQLTQLALAFFIAIIFISSYISLTNFNSAQTTTTTVPATYFAEGIASARVVGYGTPLYFNITCKSAALRSMTANAISANLTTLMDNNSVFNFYSAGRNMSVEPGNMSAYQIYSFVNRNLNSTLQNCTSVFATTFVKLPSTVNLTVNTQPAQIPLLQSYTNASLVLPISYVVGNSVKVKLTTLVTANGSVYGPINIIVLK